MLISEWQEFFKAEIQARWSTCKFNSVDIDDWRFKYGNCDKETLRTALRNYKTTDDPLRPKMSEVGHYISEAIKAARTQNFTERKHQIIELRCTSHKEAFRIGQVKKYYLPLDMHLSVEILRQQAFGRAKEHSYQYGGVWTPINLPEN